MVTVTAVLSISYVVVNLAGTSSAASSAVGRPRYEAEYAVLGAILTIGLALILGPRYGLYGVVAAVALGLAISSGWFLWRLHRLLGLPVWEYLLSWLTRLTVAVGMAAVLTRLLVEALPPGVTESRGRAVVALACLTGVYAGALVLSLRTARFLNARDLRTLRRVLPRRLERMTHLRPVEFVFDAKPAAG